MSDKFKGIKNNNWQRPKTTKLYLHPPEASRIITLWPDFKVINKKVAPGEREIEDAYGLWFIFGEDGIPLQWDLTQIEVSPKGYPIYTLKAEKDFFTLNMEIFCSWQTNPITYIRLKVYNPSFIKRDVNIGLIARSGPDRMLYGFSGDGYTSYNPMIEIWDMVRNTWRLINNNKILDADNSNRSIKLCSKKNYSISWIHRNKFNSFLKDYTELTTSLEGGEEAEFFFCISEEDEYIDILNTFETEKEKVISMYQKELDKITTKPKFNNPTLDQLFYSLVIQILQMFSTSEGDKNIRPRQGFRSSGVWPVEAIEMLIALDRIGLGDWAEKGYRFFRDMQIKQGEDAGRYRGIISPRWSNETGAVLFGLGFHLLKENSHNLFLSYRESILEAIRWIERQREKTKVEEYEGRKVAQGLFPPGRPHDWDLNGQFWCFTDGWNYMGISKMSEVFRHFNDPESKYIESIRIDYERCLKDVLKEVIKSQEDRDEIFIPNIIGIPETYPPIGPYFADGPAILIRAGIIEPESETFEKVEKYFLNRGWIKNGLTGLMTDSMLSPSDPWAGHTWYTSFSDMCWFYGWLKRGEREKAAETLNAQFKYGMTKEFYLQERYADNDPSFTPWQPNGSANGRLITMLLDFLGEERS
ncbi:MAG: hypothetical protein QXE51_04670 [Nitrososphaeria archaeon]